MAACLPRQVWYEADSQAHDQRCWDAILAALAPGTRVRFDLGFVNYGRFDHLTEHDVHVVTRVKTNAADRVERTLHWGPDRFEQLIWLWSERTRCAHLLRLIGVRRGGPGSTWQRYLTKVLDPRVLPLEDVVALYSLRWRVEDAFALVKRLLGLAYIYVSAVNAIQTQRWLTWLLDAVLVDLTDAVAAPLHQPSQAVSLELVYRGLYHFTQAAHRGQADDPVAYLAAKAKRLGIRKRRRRRAADQFGHLTTPPGP